MSAAAELPGRVAVAREAGERPNGPLLVMLHGDGHQVDELLAFARRLLPVRETIVPVGCWGTYVGAMDLSNYTWFHEVPGVDEPEPVSLGRSLLDVEQLVAAARGAGSAPVVLVGAGQGATLALALTAVLADVLAAVVAIGGRPALLPPGAVPDAVGGGPVPALWLAEPGQHERARGSGALAALAAVADVAVEPLPDGEPLGDAAVERVGGWLELTVASGRGDGR